MGRKKHDWQDRGYVLKWFGKKVKDYGIPLSEIARRVGVSTSAVSKMISSVAN